MRCAPRKLITLLNNSGAVQGCAAHWPHGGRILILIKRLPDQLPVASMLLSHDKNYEKAIVRGGGSKLETSAAAVLLPIGAWIESNSTAQQSARQCSSEAQYCARTDASQSAHSTRKVFE